MYAEAAEPHHIPHFHAYYQDDVAVFGINPIDLIAGSLSTRHRRLVEAWKGYRRASDPCPLRSR